MPLRKPWKHTGRSEIRGYPVFGVLHEIRRDPPLFLRRVMRTHGGVAAMRLGPQRLIMAGHPEAVRHVAITKASNYVKTKYIEKLKPVLGESLITTNGPAWVSTRHAVQGQMTMPAVQKLLKDMDGIVRDEIATWHGKPVDLAHRSSTLTLRLLCSTMFGQADADEIEQIVSTMDDLQAYASRACWAMVDIDKLFRRPRYRRFERCRATLSGIVHDMIARRRTGQPCPDLLQALIDAQEVETSKPLSDKRVHDEVTGALVAGHETTGCTLAFAWEKLVQDPALQERLREEAFRCLPLDAPATAANLRDMTLTISFIKEVMRLNPTVWWVARTAVADDDIMGVKVRRGDVVMITPYVTHRLEDFWTDPETFDARRFVNFKPDNNFTFIPFSVGPRICPGMHLAMLEMQLAIGRLLQRATLTGTSNAQVEGLITLRPKGGMPLIVEPLTTTVHVEGVVPGQHALIDAYSRLRTRVFVDALGWPLSVDSEGRELDQFDTPDAKYLVLVSNGHIMSFVRSLSCARASLLFDVYNDLIEKGITIDRAIVWEGTRLGTSPDVPRNARAFWVRLLIQDVEKRALAAGVQGYCSVSDPGMERLLQRAGLRTERLGPVKTDRHGFPVLALRLNCGATGIAAHMPDDSPHDELGKAGLLTA